MPMRYGDVGTEAANRSPRAQERRLGLPPDTANAPRARLRVILESSAPLIRPAAGSDLDLSLTSVSLRARVRRTRTPVAP